MSTTTQSIPTLKRRQREQHPRPTAYYDAQQHTLHFTDGVIHHFSPRDGFSVILDALGAIARATVVYYVCGSASETAPKLDWYRAPCRDGWTLRYRHDVPARRVATYERGGCRVDLRHSPAWWGDCRDAASMARAHRELEQRLRSRFGLHALLLGTPAQTGLDLLDRSLPFDREYPVLPAEVRSVIHRNSPQARRELYPRTGALPAFYYLDARFAYAACLRYVPTGAPRWDRFPRHNGDYLPYTPAFYCVTGRVPAGWRHIGLVPVKTSGDDPDAGWEWPRQPGAAFCTWVSALEYEHATKLGWELHICERVSFARQSAPGADPLEVWAIKLATGKTQQGVHMPGLWEDFAAGHDALDPLKQAAVRNIVLHTIGAFHRRENTETVIIPEDDYVFDPAYPPKRVAEGYEIVRPVPVSREMERYDHPEISAHIWGKQRVRLTAEMLSLDYADLIGCNTDAYYATRWKDRDTGKIGDYRCKGAIRAPRPAPQDYHALLALKEESEAGL